MTEILVSSTVLILALTALRLLLRGRISPRLQYALWLLALIRLLVPVSVGKTALSVENLLPHTQPAAQSAVQAVPPSATGPAAPAAASKPAPISVSNAAPAQKPAGRGQILFAVWLTGAALVGGWFEIGRASCRERV